MGNPNERPKWPEETLERVSACPVCRSTSRTRLHGNLVDNMYCAPGTWDLQQCADCGSAYLDPRPTPDSIAGAYAEYLTHGPAATSEPQGLKAAFGRVRRRLSNAYIGSLARGKGAAVALSDTLCAVLVKALVPWREVLDARYRHLRGPESGADRLLDVGSGNGDFLLRAQRLGWKAEGVDFDPKAVAAAQARGVKAQIGSIDSYAHVRDTFDVVTCSHVIEHVYEPRHLLAAMHRVLKPGGRLWIETPNIRSVGHAVFGRSWRGLEAPRHLTIFSHHSLVRMVEEAGFTITQRSSWNIEAIRFVFAASEAIASGVDSSNSRTLPLPNGRLLLALWLEALFADRQEFVTLRATKPS